MHLVDRPDVLDLAVLNKALRHALEQSRPPNWWGTGLTPAELVTVADESGIPVVWVPSAAVLQPLGAATAGNRRQVLLRYESQVVADCFAAVAECDDPWISSDQFLVRRAAETYKAGYFEAAMALAVAVGEPLAIWGSKRRVHAFSSRDDSDDFNYLRKRREDLDPDRIQAVKRRLQDRGLDIGEEIKRYGKYNLAETELQGGSVGFGFPPEPWREALITPIKHFFKTYQTDKGDAIPALASRHATVHQPHRRTPESRECSDRRDAGDLALARNAGVVPRRAHQRRIACRFRAPLIESVCSLAR